MINYSNFAGQTALVTGGASGLGRAMAEALAATGASLVLFDLNHAQARGLASDLKATHSIRAEAVEGSVTNSDDVARGCRTAIELTGRLDIVMNNAGIIGNAPSIELERAPWRGLSESQAQPACRRVIQEADRYPAQNGPPRLASEEVRPCDRQAANRDRLSQVEPTFLNWPQSRSGRTKSSSNTLTQLPPQRCPHCRRWILGCGTDN